MNTIVINEISNQELTDMLDILDATYRKEDLDTVEKIVDMIKINFEKDVSVDRIIEYHQVNIDEEDLELIMQNSFNQIRKTYEL